MLFQTEWGNAEDAPIEDIDITTTILYFSKQELKEFKELAKAAIKVEFGQEYQQKGNLSDLILKLLRNYKTEKSSEPAALAATTANNIVDPLFNPNEPF